MVNKTKKLTKWLESFGWRKGILTFFLLFLSLNLFLEPWVVTWIGYLIFEALLATILGYIAIRYIYLYLTKSKKLKENYIAKMMKKMEEYGTSRPWRIFFCTFAVVGAIASFLFFTPQLYIHTLVSLFYKDTSVKEIYTFRDVASSGRLNGATIYVEEKEGSLGTLISTGTHFEKGERYLFHYLPYKRYLFHYLPYGRDESILDGKILEHYRVDEQGNRIERY